MNSKKNIPQRSVPGRPQRAGAHGKGNNLPILMALMLAGTFGSAAAQDISTSLPLK